MRFHLDALVKTGQAECVEVDHTKPGRPPLMFRAVAGMDPAGPRDYRMLAGILADAIASQPDPAGRAAAAGRAWAGNISRARPAPRMSGRPSSGSPICSPIWGLPPRSVRAQPMSARSDCAAARF